MKKPRRTHYRKHMIRPTIYMIFTRAILGLTAAFLWKEFGAETALPKWALSCIFFGVLFLSMGWMAYLRLDGIKTPILDKRLFEWKRKPKRAYGDMIDYVDENIISFDDLEDVQKDTCRLTADLVCGVVFLALSVLGA
ncbi:hypothetical protein AGMMS49992_24460 [Clostridia bacterium]|nr:hypothetical protein AGMMS49992_24460 [Clostridia bacterium]